MRTPFHMRPRVAVLALASALLSWGGVIGCNATDKLLKAEDPDLILPGDIDSPEGAAGLRLGALVRLRDMTGGTGSAGEGPWMYSGLLADEYSSSSTFTQNDETDQRNILVNNTLVRDHFRDYHRTRTAADQAIAMLRKWTPAAVVDIAEMYFARGFAEMSLAQDFCNGIPLSSAAGDSLGFGEPLGVQQVYERALATFDSALALIPDTATASQAVLVRNAVKVGRGRALLNLARYADAAAAVKGIATSFAYNVTFVVGTGDNVVWNFTTSNRRYAIGDSIEGNARNLFVKNAIPFLSAKDPRVPASYVTTNVRNSAGQVVRVDTVKGQDGLTYARVQSRYGRSDPMAIVNGIDARLIEAEAALQAGNFATPGTGTLAILNALRAGPTAVSGSLTVSGMPALTDPVDPARRVSVFFRERAFWTFGRGQRLNDLRRLVRYYKRAPADVFPVGPFHKGGTYGPDMNFPIPQAELNNPLAHGCTDRQA